MSREIIAARIETLATSDKPPALRVVGAAVLDGDRCLAAQKGPSATREALKWEFPGGKIEPGETPLEALRREIREELSVDVDVGPSLGRTLHRGSGATIELEVYLASIVRGTVRLTEHHRCEWLGAGEIMTLDWAAADRPLLESLIRVLEERSRRRDSSRDYD